LSDLVAVAAEVRKKMPWEIRDSPEARTAASEAAVSAMFELLNGNLHAGIGDLRAAAASAIEAFVVALRHECRCQKLLDDRWWLRLPDGTAEEQSQAKAAVARALHELPATASYRDLGNARDAALALFHTAIAKAHAEQQAMA
jgi:hypothetical protein